MALVVFILSLLLAVCGLGGIVASLDLLPTEMGVLYFGCGVMAVCTATLLFALGVVVARIDSLERDPPPIKSFAPPPAEEAETAAPPPVLLDPAARREETPERDDAVPVQETRPEPASPESEELAVAPHDAVAVTGGETLSEPASEPAAEPAPEPPPEPEPEDADAGAQDALNENRAGHFPTFRDVEAALARPEAPPAIVGRYSAGGAHYRIYSDGSIEAETEEGEFKFGSMTEFKAFIAARRA